MRGRSYFLILLFAIWVAYIYTQEQEIALDTSTPILLFDGVCNLCNGFVNFIIEVDSYEVFQFAALQSTTGGKILEKYGIPNDLKSMVLIDNNQAYTQSTAAIHVFKRLPMPFRMGYHIGSLFPRYIRDLVYTSVAENRYAIFGSSDECRAPTPELQARFLDDTFNVQCLEETQNKK